VENIVLEAQHPFDVSFSFFQQQVVYGLASWNILYASSGYLQHVANNVSNEI
jgi:hypothetical protein